MSNPWDGKSAPVNDPRRDERERAETRYRNVTGDRNPLARPPILPGEEGYEGGGDYLPQAGVVVRSPWEGRAEAVTDGQLLADARALSFVEGSGSTQAVAQGLTLGFSDELAGLTARLGQQGRNAFRRARGQEIEVTGDDYGQAVLDATRAEQARFASDRPFANALLQIGGGALTGGVGAARAGIANAARVGLGYGATAGLGTSEGTFAERLPGAAVGAAVGGVTGGAVQGAGQVLAPRLSGAVSRLSSIANPGGAARTAYRQAARTAQRAGASRADSELAGAEASAAVRLASVIDEPAAVTERARLQGLGVNASALDLMDNTGERLVRSAAGPAGRGADIAVRNARARTSDLRPEIMNATQGLSPDARTATEVREALEETRGRLANEMYAPAYETPVEVTDELVSALADAPGRAALARARQAAVARRNADQVAEIDRLLAGQAGGEVSAGTLDRVRIAMSNRAEALGRNTTGARDVAGGLRGRASDIDAALENVPELAPAREAYADLSGAMERIAGASGILRTDPADFARQVQTLTPTQREAAIIGLRQEIIDTLGGQRAAGTGTLQNLSESNYARRNLESLLGPTEAERYIARIEAGVQQAQRANRVSPNTNSQTFGRGIDDETFNAANMVGATVDAGQALTGNLVAIGRTIDRIRARATLSSQEREAIVRLGLGPAEDLERILELARQAQTRGGRSREATAYLNRARNVLGAQSPVTQQLERLLAPRLVAAEEEQER